LAPQASRTLSAEPVPAVILASSAPVRFLPAQRV